MNDSCYHLEFTCNGTLVDGETYSSLNSARSTAFAASMESGLEVSICFELGTLIKTLEVVKA